MEGGWRKQEGGQGARSISSGPEPPSEGSLLHVLTHMQVPGKAPSRGAELATGSVADSRCLRQAWLEPVVNRGMGRLALLQSCGQNHAALQNGEVGGSCGRATRSLHHAQGSVQEEGRHQAKVPPGGGAASQLSSENKAEIYRRPNDAGLLQKPSGPASAVPAAPRSTPHKC